MAEFNRFDICEAYLVIEADWNEGGIFQDRVSNQRRAMSTGFQLDRMGFKTGHKFHSYSSLTENGKEIYIEQCEKYELDYSDFNVEGQDEREQY